MDKKRLLIGLMVLLVMLLITGCSILNNSPKKANDDQNTPKNSSPKQKISQDIKVDFREDGLTYDDYRIDVDNHEYEKGPIEIGSELTLNTYGVSGYKEIDGLVYPLLEQKVTDSKGEVVYEEIDLIPEDADGIDAETASETYTYVGIDSNYKSGETYHWITKYSDRKGNAMLDAMVDFVVE